MGKTAAHIIYRTGSGQPVPGVTTILSVLNKPALVKWANKLGLQGIDVEKYVSDKGDIGTLAHSMIISYLQGTELDTSDYTPKQVDQAETCLIKFWEWENQHEISTILSEARFVSESLKFGGTIDWYGHIDGATALVDFKTSSGIFPEMAYQLSAYSYLLGENDMHPASFYIIRVGRDQEEGFEYRSYIDLAKEWQIFTHCLAIHNLRKRR